MPHYAAGCATTSFGTTVPHYAAGCSSFGTTVPHYAAGCATTSFSCAAPAAAGTATCAPCAPCVETAARPSRLRQRGVQAAAGGHQRPEFLEEDTVVRAPHQELEWRAVVAPA